MGDIRIRIVNILDGDAVVYQVSTRTKRDPRTNTTRRVWGEKQYGELVRPVNGVDMIHLRSESGSPDYRLNDFPRVNFVDAVGKEYQHKPNI